MISLSPVLPCFRDILFIFFAHFPSLLIAPAAFPSLFPHQVYPDPGLLKSPQFVFYPPFPVSFCPSALALMSGSCGVMFSPNHGGGGATARVLGRQLPTIYSALGAPDRARRGAIEGCSPAASPFPLCVGRIPRRYGARPPRPPGKSPPDPPPHRPSQPPPRGASGQRLVGEGVWRPEPRIRTPRAPPEPSLLLNAFALSLMRIHIHFLNQFIFVSELVE